MSLSQLNAEINIKFICSDIYFYNITDKLQHFISFCFKISILGVVNWNRKTKNNSFVLITGLVFPHCLRDPRYLWKHVPVLRQRSLLSFYQGEIMSMFNGRYFLNRLTMLYILTHLIFTPTKENILLSLFKRFVNWGTERFKSGFSLCSLFPHYSNRPLNTKSILLHNSLKYKSERSPEHKNPNTFKGVVLTKFMPCHLLKLENLELSV